MGSEVPARGSAGRGVVAVERFARLDKTGWRILCSVCGWELGIVGSDHVVRDSTAIVQPGGIRRDLAPSFAAFPPGGWAPNAYGVWRETRRGRGARRRAGDGGLPRHDPFKRRLSTPDFQVEGRLTGIPVRLLAPWDLPVTAECSKCEARQQLDPERLRVDPNPMPARDPLGGQTPSSLGRVVFATYAEQ